MLHRLIAGAIVAFWAVMTALLIHSRFSPTRSEFMALPIEHVLRVMMRHGQASELAIASGGERIGGIGIQPSREGEPNAFSIRGNVTIKSPPLARQRVSWEANFHLADNLTVDRLDAQINLREPPSVSRFTWLPAHRRLDYSLADIGDASAASTGSIETTSEGLRDFLESLGAEPALLDNLSAIQGSPPPITARRSQLAIRNQKTEVFVVTVGPPESPLATAWISQIGQVLRATSALGYSLEAEDFGP